MCSYWVPIFMCVCALKWTYLKSKYCSQCLAILMENNYLFLLLILCLYIVSYIYIGVRGIWIQMLGVLAARARVIIAFVNVSEMRSRSRLSSQLLTIPAPWVLFRVGGLSLCLNGSTLGDCLPFPWKE